MHVMHPKECICSQCISIGEFIRKKDVFASSIDIRNNAFLSLIKNEIPNQLPYDICDPLQFKNSDLNFTFFKAHSGGWDWNTSTDKSVDKIYLDNHLDSAAIKFIENILKFILPKQIKNFFALINSYSLNKISKQNILAHMEVDENYWSIHDVKYKTNMINFFSDTLPKTMILLQLFPTYRLHSETIFTYAARSNNAPLFYFFIRFAFGTVALSQNTPFVKNEFLFSKFCWGNVKTHLEEIQLEPSITIEDYKHKYDCQGCVDARNSPVVATIFKELSHSLGIALQSMVDSTKPIHIRHSAHVIAHTSVIFYASPFYKLPIENFKNISFARDLGLINDLIVMCSHRPMLLNKIYNSFEIKPVIDSKNTQLAQAFQSGSRQKLEKSQDFANGFVFRNINILRNSFVQAVHQKNNKMIEFVLQKMLNHIKNNKICDILGLFVQYREFFITDINDQSGKNLVHHLAMFTSAKSLKLLFDFADLGLPVPDINGTDKNQETPLFAAITAQAIECIVLLITKNAKLSHLYHQMKRTSIHYLAILPNPTALQAVLSSTNRGPYFLNIDEADKNGETPLFAAISSQNLESALILIKYGAKFDKLNSHNWDAIQTLAAYFSPKNERDWINARLIIKALLDTKSQYTRKFDLPSDHPCAIACHYDNEASFTLFKSFSLHHPLKNQLESHKRPKLSKINLHDFHIEQRISSRFLWWYQHSFDRAILIDGQHIPSLSNHFPHSAILNLSFSTLGTLPEKLLVTTAKYNGYTSRGLFKTSFFPFHYKNIFKQIIYQAINNDDIATLHFFDCYGFKFTGKKIDQLNVKNKTYVSNYLKNISKSEINKSKVDVYFFKGNYEILEHANIIDDYRETALFQLIREQNVLTTRMLLSYRFDINHQNHTGITPVMIASALPSLQILKLLIENNGDINTRTVLGWSAIFFAIAAGQNANISYLLSRPNINLKNKTKQGESIIDFLIAFNRFDLLECHIDILQKHLKDDYNAYLSIDSKFNELAHRISNLFPIIIDRKAFNESLTKKIRLFVINKLRNSTILFFRFKEDILARNEKNLGQLYVKDYLPTNTIVSTEILSAAKQGQLHINLPKHDKVTQNDIQQIIIEITVAALLGDMGGISLEPTPSLKTANIERHGHNIKIAVDSNVKRVVMGPGYIDTLVATVWMYTDYFLKIASKKATFIPSDKIQLTEKWYDKLNFCDNCLDGQCTSSDLNQAMLDMGALDPRKDKALENLLTEYANNYYRSCSQDDDFHSWYITMRAFPYEVTYREKTTVLTPKNKMEFIIRKWVNGDLVERNNEHFADAMNRHLLSVYASETYGRYFQLHDIINQLKPIIENLLLSGILLAASTNKYQTYSTPRYMPIAICNASSNPQNAHLSGGVSYQFTQITTVQAQFVTLPTNISSLPTASINYQQNSYLCLDGLPSNTVTKHTFVNSGPWLQNSINFDQMSRHEKGDNAERLVADNYHARGFVQLASKMGSNQGIDGVYYKENTNGTIDIELNETKYNPQGHFKSRDTQTKGTQMSQFWVRETVSRMMAYDKDPDVQRVGNSLAQLINEEGPGFFSRRTITVVDRHKNIHWYSENAIKEYNINTFQNRLAKK